MTGDDGEDDPGPHVDSARTIFDLRAVEGISSSIVTYDDSQSARLVELRHHATLKISLVQF